MKYSAIAIGLAIIGVNIYKNDPEIYTITAVLFTIISGAFLFKKLLK